MATLATSVSAITAERRFYLMLAAIIAVTVFAGFGLDLQRTDWNIVGLPAQVHLHAAVFFGWIILYVAQNWLVDRGSIAMHRRLGVATACLVPVMVVVGVATTVMAVRLNRVPPFFTPGLFLALDLQIIGFAILAGWAIQLRHRSDWHKRLMLCATILIMSPALGRILPMPLMGPSGTWAIFIATMAYLGAAMLFDAQLRGRVHLAYWWGAGMLTLVQLLIGIVGFSPRLDNLIAQLAA